MSEGRQRSAAGLIIKTLIITATSAVIGILLLIMSFMIPDDKIQYNVSSSIDSFRNAMLGNEELQNRYPWWHLQGDPYMDELLIIEASYDGDEPAVEKAVMIYKYAIDGIGYPGSLWEHYKNGTEYDIREDYVRYWHGFIIFLRPLLAIMQYDGIIRLNALLQLVLTALVIFLMRRRGLSDCIIPYFIMYGILMPVITWRTMQYYSCFYVMILGCLLILLFEGRRKEETTRIIFLITGICLAYFDLLTYPVMTLGIPLVLYLRMHIDDTFINKFKGCFFNSLMWGIGYIGMWACKGLVTFVLMRDAGIFGELFTNVVYRMSSNDENGGSYGIKDVLYLNVRRFINSPFMVVMILFVIWCTVRIVMRIAAGRMTIGRCLSIVCIFAIIAVMPFAWYMVTVNHSSIHCWYTNKSLTVSVFAMLCAVSYAAKGEGNRIEE